MTAAASQDTLRLALVALVVAAAWGAAAPVANAFVLTKTDSGIPVHWATDLVRFGIAVGGSTTMPLDQKGTEFEAIRRAFHSWEAVSASRLRFDYAGRMADEDVPNLDDGINGVRFFSGANVPVDVSDAIAVTLVTFNSRTGEIFDADILLNERDFRFSTLPSGSTVDLESVALHEIGHLVGLDHTCGSSGEVQPSCFDPELSRDPARYQRIFGAVMFPMRGVGDPPLRTPTADDAQGIATLYPAPSAQVAPYVDAVGPSAGSGRGSLAAVGGGFLAGVTLRFALDGSQAAPREAVVMEVMPSRLTATFDLTGLAPGCYDVIAQNASGKQGALIGGFAVAGAVCQKPKASGCSAVDGSGSANLGLYLLILAWVLRPSWALHSRHRRRGRGVGSARRIR